MGAGAGVAAIGAAAVHPWAMARTALPSLAEVRAAVQRQRRRQLLTLARDQLSGLRLERNDEGLAAGTWAVAVLDGAVPGCAVAHGARVRTKADAAWDAIAGAATAALASARLDAAA